MTEENLLQDGKHVLVAYNMKPNPGHDYLAAAARFAAESTIGNHVHACLTDKNTAALVYFIDPENEVAKIAYPVLLFNRDIADGRAMLRSVLTSSVGDQGMGDAGSGQIHDI